MYDTVDTIRGEPQQMRVERVLPDRVAAQKNWVKTAFAVGGLAGNNAQGAGFLHAALQRGVTPDIITCTSGQIYWVYRYLQERGKNNGDLRKVFEEDQHHHELFHNLLDRYYWSFLHLPVDEAVKRPVQVGIDVVAKTMHLSIFHNPWLRNNPFSNFFLHPRDWDLWLIALVGIPDRMSVPLPHIFHDCSMNLINAWYESAFCQSDSVFNFREFLDLLPARALVPKLFDHELLKDMCNTFERSDIGIVFNSFDPRQGIEYIHINAAAQRLLNVKFGPAVGTSAATGSAPGPVYRDRIVYDRITPEAIKGALWIYQYGFEEPFRDRVDGAYFRQIILSELQCVEEIYVARPVNFRWIGNTPRTWTELQDMQTEVNLNGSYEGERDKLLMINKLIASGVITDPNFKPIKLKEIEIRSQRGFFDYMFEDMELFDQAVQQAKAILP